MNKNIFLSIFVLFSLIVVWSLSAKADEISGDTWETAKKKMESVTFGSMSDEAQCQFVWDTLWRWSKRGNVEARYNLFRFVYPGWPGLPHIMMPGRVGDEISLVRDSAILGVYSLEYRSDVDIESFLNETIGVVPAGQWFIQCIKEDSIKSCVRAAHSRANLIPSFEEYALEIDTLIAGGAKQKCLYFKDGNYKKR